MAAPNQLPRARARGSRQPVAAEKPGPDQHSQGRQSQIDGHRLHKQAAGQGQQSGAGQRGGAFGILLHPAQQDQQPQHGQQIVDQRRAPGVDLLPQPPGGDDHQGGGEQEGLSPAHRFGAEAPGQQQDQGNERAAQQHAPEKGQGGDIQLGLEHAQQVAQVAAVVRDTHHQGVLGVGPG